MLLRLGIVLHVLLVTVYGQPEELADPTNPCSHSRTINLPKDGKCLVPVRTAYDWTTAQAACERAGGSLYQHPNARLQSRPTLMNCLASMADTKFDDMWLNAVGIWYPHFFWINMTVVNEVNYCTREVPPRDDASSVPITSDTLSVDYCVSTCHDSGARFIVLHNGGKSPECYCKHELDSRYQLPCYTNTFQYKDTENYYIIHAKEDDLIKLAASEAFSKTEILCATVDHATKDNREMRSDTCFTAHPFLCCLGEATKCTSLECSGTECRFLMKDKCMLRVASNYNWYAARAYCVAKGGDLWNMHELNEMNQVTQFLDGVSRYWIGASNYGWTFNATSADLSKTGGDFNLARCGHMFRERLSTTSSGTWQWGDTVCDQQKSFLCEFPKTTFTREEIDREVSCPWPITVISVPDETQTPIPFVNNNQSSSGDSFPIAAVIAACVAALVLLTCLALAAGYCHRQGKFKKAKEHLAFIPYFADVSGAADYSATMQSNMSSVSERGSQIGLVKGGGYQSGMSAFAMSTSYGEQNGMFQTQSLDRRQKDSMARKLTDSQNYLVNGNSSLDERGFAATYSTLPLKTRDYMTLQAQMDIKDEAELAALRGSLRGKPEVTLVTDNVDMNFTVNHAISRSQSHAGSEPSRSSLERTMEEITLPVSEGGHLRNLPERVAEARIYTSHSNI
ncbi:uncharacterized protein LOC131932673 [Physella acuta]|uniref:uncharacterized protein LOC131932673 n=1 Tax=Physella acuta TaxID=109671 RepID=UPI0027DE103C|nr:uncharacterized protein LOC131932673 [Physella acuta]XP_059145595.1 uncharacterized protein LOC131932673 [Physella acuta]